MLDQLLRRCRFGREHLHEVSSKSVQKVKWQTECQASYNPGQRLRGPISAGCLVYVLQVEERSLLINIWLFILKSAWINYDLKKICTFPTIVTIIHSRPFSFIANAGFFIILAQGVAILANPAFRREANRSIQTVEFAVVRFSHLPLHVQPIN